MSGERIRRRCSNRDETVSLSEHSSERDESVSDFDTFPPAESDSLGKCARARGLVAAETRQGNQVG